MDFFIYLVFISNILQIEAVSLLEQLQHVVKRRQESNGIKTLEFGSLPSRRAHFEFDPNDVGAIIGAPSIPSHLPEAEPILPGHTLLRPALGMLKSSIKFPHVELDSGAGVLGNMHNLGIKYDGRNERILYSGFRRSGGDRYRKMTKDYRRTPANFIMVVPSKKPRNSQNYKPSFSLVNLVIDLERKMEAEEKIKKRLRFLQAPIKNNTRLLIYLSDPRVKPFLSDLVPDINPLNFKTKVLDF